LKAPFPYFGGKSAIAPEVWARLGSVDNYVEPFCGSAAVLLARPDWPGTGRRLVETVNDADGLLSNFWRALQADAAAVAHHADWPVNEADLHARHLWLLGQRERITERLMGDADFFDAKAAGWWAWGACAWIASGWCSGRGPWVSRDGVLVRGDKRSGVPGVHRKLPHLGDAGQGINRQLPHFGNAGRGVNRAGGPAAHLLPLAERLRGVRVACGDWRRVVSGSVLWPFTGSMRNKRVERTVGVFLDPPYGEGFDGAYAATSGLAEEASIAADVWRWAVEAGSDPAVRIVVAGYDDGRAVPDGWQMVRWDALKRSSGAGYGSRTEAGRDNARREVLWCSPHCVRPEP
jgi:hypothetical protein